MKIKHVLRTAEFKEIVSVGEKHTGKTVSLYKKEYPPEKGFAIGVIIAKKYAGKAVRRNYIKRAIYSFFREHTSVDTEAAGVVVRVTKGMDSLTRKECFQAVVKDLDALTKMARICGSEKRPN